MDGEVKTFLKWLGIIVVVVLVLVIASVLCYPLYNVYNQKMEGRAQLLKSESSKMVLIEQAKAEVEAAKLRAEAIQIVGEAAKKYPEYRTQEFIGGFAEALKEGKISQIIYVPTEANIPILEAGSRR